MEEILSKGRETNYTTKQKILSFTLMREIQDGEAKNSERLNTTLRRSDSRKGRNLWDHLTNLRDLDHGVQFLFKAKQPKRYVQVKTSLVNEGTQILAVCTDITRIIELEKQGQVLRAQFFSSIAHELRTPLNSVIPILKLILTLLSSGQVPVDIARVTRLLHVVHNGTIHL